MSPESKFPAANECIDTIICGKDGNDYVVDIIDGIRKWVPYLPLPDDVVTIEHIKKDVCKEKGEVSHVEKNTPKQPSPNRYQQYLKDMTAKLKNENPDLAPKDRLELIRKMWKDINHHK